MNGLIETGNQMPIIKVWNNQRVVTLADIDTVHEREKGTAKKNFDNNKRHFILGVDFFETTRKELQENFSPNSKLIGNPQIKTYLLIESGYLMIVKSFTDDLSWQVQRQLVNNYFRQKQDEPPALTELDKYKVSVSGTWFERNNWKIKLILDTYDFDRKYLYHKILSEIGEVYRVDMMQLEHERRTVDIVKFKMDLLDIFPVFGDIATNYLDFLLKGVEE